MKKMKSFIKSNIKLVIGIIIGAIISGTTVYAATILFNSNQVGYDNTSSGMSATNVQDALDELYTKANNQYFDISTAKSNSTGKVFASSKGVCINRNQNVYCFKINNINVEKVHAQEVFSDGSCYAGTTSVECGASDFTCNISSSSVMCGDLSNYYSTCTVTSDGSVNCR